MPLRVTVELIPGGDTSRAEKIGQLYIVNTGDHLDGPQGDERRYEIADVLRDKGQWDVTHHRSDGAWALIRKAIEGMP
jgi:hypothetical protein